MSTPNPFDALDEPTNPFDTLDTPAKTPVAYAPYDPTEGMSGYQKFMAGAGKAVVDTGRGLQQLGALAGNKLGLVSDQTRAAIQQQINESQRLDQPLMRTGAGLAGNIAGYAGEIGATAGLGDIAAAAGAPGAGAVSAALNPTTLAGGAASGAALGAIQPVATDQSRLFNVVAGGVGGAAGNLLSRVPGMFMRPEEASTKAVQALTDAGVPLDAAQRTGSVMLQRAKAMLSDNPITAGAQRDFQEMQARSFTKAALGTIGSDANEASPQVMAAAKARLGNVYDDIASRTAIPYSSLEEPLSNIETEARLRLNDSQFAVVRRNFDDILNKASQNNGFLNGAQFKNVKQTLDGLSMGSDSDVGEVARDMRAALHQGLTSSASPEDAALLARTNVQWGNMRKLEGAIANDTSGLISPSKLANSLSIKSNRYNSVYGQGDQSLVNLAQAGKSLLADKVPQSGTIPRALAQIAVGGLPGAAIGTYEGIKTGDWRTAAKIAAGGLILPKLIQRGIQSQGAFGGALSTIGRAAGASVPSSAAVGAALQALPRGTLSGLANREGLGTSRKPPEPTQ